MLPAVVAAALSLHASQDLPRLDVGKTIEFRIENGDPVVETETLGKSYADSPVLGRSYSIELGEPGAYTLELRSYFFDAYLVLRDAAGKLLAEDDDGLFIPQSRIVFEATPQARRFRVDACALHGDLGPGELRLLRGKPAALAPEERRSAGIEDARAGLRVVEAEKGPDHPDTARSLDMLAQLLFGAGNFAEARPLFERALAIREKALGPEDPNTAVSLNNLAVLLRTTGNYREARPLFERSLAGIERVYGPESLETAAGIGNLAWLLQNLGSYREARPLFERALAIHEKVLGPEDRATAASLSSLAWLLQSIGCYGEARKNYARALAIDEKVLGPEHPATAGVLDNLGLLLQLMGNYTEARPLYERGLAIREKTLGPTDYKTAWSLNNLGWLLQCMGNYSEARPLFERALAIQEKVLGPDHPDTARSINNLGNLLQSLGHPEEALPLYERALASRERVLGPEHPETAWSLIGVARARQAMGKFDEARPLFERALAIDEKVLGPEHANTAACLVNLAFLQKLTGNGTEARRLFERALAIDEKTLGLDHSSTTATLSALAQVQADLGERGTAWELASTAFERAVWNLRRTFPVVTEAERMNLCASICYQMELSSSLEPPAPEPNTRRRTYAAVLAWKGQVTRASLEDRERTLRSLSTEQRTRVEDLRGVQAQISTEVSKAVPADREARERRLSELRDRRSALERELLAAGGSQDQATDASVADLLARLPRDSAFVDLIVHHNYLPAGKGNPAGTTAGTWTVPHVTAWIVRGGSESIERIDLGDAGPLRVAIQGLLQLLQGERGISPPAEKSGEALSQANDRVRELVWKPILPTLAGATRILVSPDRFLGTFPFETLLDEDGRYLLEKFTISYVSDGATLASMLESNPPPPSARESSLISIGGIDYDARGKPPAENSGEDRIAASSVRGSFQDYWEPLRFTRKEAETVFSLHEAMRKKGPEAGASTDDGSRMILGSEALEEVLKREVAGKRFVHIATHGYFQPEGLPSMWENARENSGTGQAAMTGETERVTGLLPGLLSGLVCAGANLPAEEGRDDGFLTAEEVTWLDLRNCDLLVLSACQTALGRDRAGEGMMSLQRAFQIAGAKSVISSLWSVDDERTVELMRAFYRHLWLDGQSRRDALRSAQIELLARNRAERQGRGLPWTWAAFVLYGDWR